MSKSVALNPDWLENQDVREGSVKARDIDAIVTVNATPLQLSNAK